MTGLAPSVIYDNTQYNIVIVGDSIDGLNYATGWHQALWSLFPQKKLKIFNAAVDGIRIGGSGGNTMLDFAPTTVDTKIIPGAVNILLMGGGTNDICSMVALGRSLTDIYNDWVTYVEDRLTAGFDYVIPRCVLPRTQTACAAVVAGTFETDRQSLITLQDSYCITNNIDMCRCDLNANIGQAGDSDNTTYYKTDKVHLNPTGGIVLADCYEVPLSNILNS